MTARPPQKRWWAGQAWPTYKSEVLEFVLKTAQENPHLSHAILLSLVREKYGEANTPSKSSISKLLSRCGETGAREAALLADLEIKWLNGKCHLTRAWQNKLFKRNPALAEHERETQAPGERVCQAWFPVGKYETVTFYVHATVDTFGSFATGEIFCGMETELAIELLHRVTLPCYANAKVKILELETKSCRTYTAEQNDYSYDAFLRLHGITHQTRPSYEAHNGFLQKFRQSLLPGFLLSWRQRLESVIRRRGRRPSPQLEATRARKTLLEMRHGLREWLQTYNDTPQEGYRNRGKCPREFWNEKNPRIF